MDITNDDLFLDFETRSKAKLLDVGAWRYAEDPSTKPLCLAYAIGHGKPELWIEGQPQPKALIDYFVCNKRIHGWNAISFERAIFEVIMGPRYGWVTPKLENYYDTMSDALALALPGKLKDAGPALQLSELKDPEGDRLIKLLCVPISSGKKKGQFREREEFIHEYVKLYNYCKQDVISERAIYADLPFEVTGQEREIMLLVARMNERGVPIDRLAVERIREAIEYETEALKVQFHLITGVDSPTNRAKYLTWLNSQLHPVGINLLDTKAETLRDLRKLDSVPPIVRSAMDIGKAITKTSNAKYQSILDCICKDGTVKNNLIYHKATTGRLAGAGFQLQNLISDVEPEPEPLIEAFIDKDYDFIRWYKGILETASSLIRSMIKAFPGFKFINGDLKGVEMRGSAWAAREWDILEQLGKGVDPYKITAAKMYNVVIDAVTKMQRQAGKICVLACGFGGAFGAILNMANKMNIEVLEADAKRYASDFRKARPKLVATWYAFGRAAVAAVENPGEVFYPETDDGPDKRFKFVCYKKFLFLVLPSGRKLAFPYPEVQEEYFKGRYHKVVTAMWIDSKIHKWMRRSITGASFFQSAVQGLCRDLLMQAHLRIEEDGMPHVLSVHDEGQAYVPDTPAYSVSRFEQLMCVVPKWADKFPIAADCWEGYRYKK